MASKTKESIPKRRKLVIIGDAMCGKTCLLLVFKDDQFIHEHPATIFETYVVDVQIDEQTITLDLVNITCQEGYDRLRPFSYPDTNVILLCFSVDNPASVTNIIEKWTPEVHHYCGTCPVILVACKIDLRTDPGIITKLRQGGERPITTEVGRQIAAQINADGYMECSAKTREGVQELFLHAARLSLKKFSHNRSHKCVLH